MRIDFEPPIVMALQASQHAVATGTGMYSKPAARPVCSVVSPEVDGTQPNSSDRVIRP